MDPFMLCPTGSAASRPASDPSSTRWEARLPTPRRRRPRIRRPPPLIPGIHRLSCLSLLLIPRLRLLLPRPRRCRPDYYVCASAASMDAGPSSFPFLLRLRRRPADLCIAASVRAPSSPSSPLAAAGADVASFLHGGCARGPLHRLFLFPGGGGEPCIGLRMAPGRRGGDGDGAWGVGIRGTEATITGCTHPHLRHQALAP